MKTLFALLAVLLVLSVVPAQAQLSAIAAGDANSIFAAGTGGLVQHSSDAGATWLKQTSGTTNYLFSISTTSSAIAFTAGGNPISGGGTMLKTTNGGASWVSQTLPAGTQPLLSVSMASSTDGFAVGFGGQLLHTTNGGTTWTAISTGVLTTFNGVYTLSSSVAWIVGDFGVVMKTTNSGTNWTQQTSGTTNDLYAVKFVSANAGIACGTGGCIIRTTNGGTTWVTEPTGTSFNLNGCTLADSAHGWAVGANGVILVSANGGSTWAFQSGAAANFSDVSFVSTTVGWVSSDRSPTVLNTTDGGSHWVQPGGTGGGCTIPSIPTLTSPANGSTGLDTTVFFTWSGSTCAKKYNLQVAIDPTFSSIVLNDTTFSTSASDTVFKSSTYYWRVRAIGDSGTSAFSSTFSFSTALGTPVFAITPTSLAFGTIPLTQSKTLTVTVSNPGGGTLTVTNAVSSSSTYTVISFAAFSLNAGQTKTITISAHPLKKNTTVSGTVTFTFNATGSPFVLPMTCKGGAH